MKDIFNNKEFNKSLEGGVKDLDEDIGSLVYTLYKKDIVKTIWSCSGHTAKRLENIGSSNIEGYWVYEHGKLFFEKTNNNSNKFIDYLKSIQEKYSFARLKEIDHKYFFSLDMEDLVEKYTKEDILTLSPKLGVVKIDLAKKRHEGFKDVWSEIEKLANKSL